MTEHSEFQYQPPHEVRVIVPTTDGYVDYSQPTNGTPWGTQAERMVAAAVDEDVVG